MNHEEHEEHEGSKEEGMNFRAGAPADEEALERGLAVFFSILLLRVFRVLRGSIFSC